MKTVNRFIFGLLLLLPMLLFAKESKFTISPTAKTIYWDIGAADIYDIKRSEFREDRAILFYKGTLLLIDSKGQQIKKINNVNVSNIGMFAGNPYPEINSGVFMCEVNHVKSLFDINGTLIKTFPNAISSTLFDNGVAQVLVKETLANKQTRTYRKYINNKGSYIYPALTADVSQYLGVSLFNRVTSNGRMAFLDYKTSKWGFCDTLGNIVIPAKYINVQDFSDGIAFVFDYEKAKWIGIDINGKQSFPLELTHQPSPFSEGFSVILKADKSSCVVNKAGQILANKYANNSEDNPYDIDFSLPVVGFTNGYLILSGGDRELHVLDRDFKLYRKIEGSSLLYEPQIKYVDGYWCVENAIYDSKFNLVLENDYQMNHIGLLGNGLVQFRGEIEKSAEEVYGYCNLKGEVVILIRKNEF